MSLLDLYRDHADSVQFLMVYIREAHPIDGWSFGSNAVQIRDPVDIVERREVATLCESTMKYGIQTYVDEMDDAVMHAYAAWPERRGPVPQETKFLEPRVYRIDQLVAQEHVPRV